jgi:hypothetical protein
MAGKIGIIHPKIFLRVPCHLPLSGCTEKILKSFLKPPKFRFKVSRWRQKFCRKHRQKRHLSLDLENKNQIYFINHSIYIINETQLIDLSKSSNRISAKNEKE